MYCFMCGTEAGNAHVCPVCGADILLYKQILYTSDVYYNQGLEKARVRDLSGAITALKSSLSYNKRNTRARNLLGLIYYEMGEIVKALNEWIISKNFQEDNPFADRYLGEIENTPGLFEKQKQNIRKYNQALEYCKSGNRDLAIIQLKKVVATNPKYVVAYQLLTLLCINNGQYLDARKYILLANAIDANNTLTQRYMQEIKEGLKKRNESKRIRKREIKSFMDGNDLVMMPENSFNSMFSGGSSITYIIVGLVIGLLICFFLVVPTVRQDARAEAVNAFVGAGEELNNSATDIRLLKDENKTLKEELEGYTGMADVKTSYELLLEAQNYLNVGVRDSAVENVLQVNVDILDEKGKELYDRLFESLSFDIALNYYTYGQEFYNSENYENAILNLEKVVQINENYDNGAALYLLADSYRLAGKGTLAKPYYEKVYELYPKSIWGQGALNYIDITTIEREKPIKNTNTDEIVEPVETEQQTQVVGD